VLLEQAEHRVLKVHRVHRVQLEHQVHPALKVHKVQLALRGQVEQVVFRVHRVRKVQLVLREQVEHQEPLEQVERQARPVVLVPVELLVRQEQQAQVVQVLP
jgi:hypothetical protein